MHRGTTPTLILDLSKSKSLDLTNVTACWVTIKSKIYKNTWTLERCTIDDTKNTISITLSQEETLQLPPTKAMIQVRLLLGTGVALATDEVEINIKDILKGGIIE